VISAQTAELRLSLRRRVLQRAADYRRRVAPLTPQRLAAGIAYQWRRAPLAGRDGLLDPASKTIVVAAEQAPVRQLFSLAHEVMHYLIENDEELLSDLHEAYEGRRLEAALEQLCNLGAAEMLLPQRSVLDSLAESGANPRLIWELAARHAVSQATAAVALTTSLGDDSLAAIWGGRPMSLFFGAGLCAAPRGAVLPPNHPLNEVASSGLPHRGPLKLPGSSARSAWARAYRGRVYLLAEGVQSLAR